VGKVWSTYGWDDLRDRDHGCLAWWLIVNIPQECFVKR
jgi:hypothetical protein